MAKKPASKSASPAVASGDGLKVGDKAPAFSLPDQNGKVHSLKDMAGKFVVLYFYPKDNTSGCTVEACQFRDSFGHFTKKNVVLLGVSPDDEKSHAKFVKKFELPFTLLADTEKKTVEAYKVWKEKSMYGRKYMGVVRSTFLIGPDGKIAFVWEKVSVPGHDADVLKKIEELGK